MLNFDKYYIVINIVSVSDNGKNDSMHISNFCKSCKIELIEKILSCI